MNLKIGSTYCNAVAVPEKYLKYRSCAHCVFFDKNHTVWSKQCICATEGALCYDEFGSDLIALFFISPENRTI